MIKILVKYRFLFLLILIILTVLAGLKASSIQINTNFSQFLPDNDSEYAYYKWLSSEIKDDEYILVIGIHKDSSIYESKFLQNVKTFEDRLSQIKGVKKIQSLNSLTYPVKSLFGIMGVPYLSIKNRAALDISKKKIKTDISYTQNFINKDNTALFIWLELDDTLNDAQIEVILKELNQLIVNDSNLTTHLWGKRYLQKGLNDVNKNETQKFALYTLCFLIVILYLIFKTTRTVILSVLLVSMAFILFIGGMAVLHRPFNIMSNLFPTIILIVAISDIIHLSVKYQIEIANGKTSKQAIYNSIKEIGRAIFITSFTTAIGFFILQISPMKVLRDFGLEAGIAVISTFVITFILIPSFFLGAKNKHYFSFNKSFNAFASRFLKWIIGLQNYPKTVLSFYGVLILVGLLGIIFINTNNRQYSIPNKSDLKKNYTFFEQQLGGSRTFELIISAKDNEVLNSSEILNQLNNLHNYLDSLHYLKALKSPLLFYRIMHKAYHPSLNLNSDLLLDQKTIKMYDRQINRFSSAKYLQNKKKTLFKFSAQMKDLGRQNVSAKNEHILNHLNTLIDPTKVSAKITGIDYLFDKAHKTRIENMLHGLILAIIIVAITLGLIFRNISITLLALLLNIIPIIISAGIMGFTNIELRAGNSIIFTIAFVIAVDNTIHLLSKFHCERKQGHSVEQALKIAITDCGKAILATSIILLGSFSILMISDFNEIFTLGFLMGVIILITLTVDLILAPVMILTWFKTKL